MSDNSSSNGPPISGWKWYTREIVALISWSLIILAPSISHWIDKETLNWLGSVVSAERVIIGAFLILGVSWLIGFQAMWHIAFIAAYPLIVPLRILPRLFIRYWPLVFIFLPGIRGLVRGMRLRSGLLCIAVAATFAAFSFTTLPILMLCWVTLCAYLLWIFGHQLHMAFRPATAYSELVEILQNLATRFPSPKSLVTTLKNTPPPADPTSADAERSHAANLFILYGISSALYYVARHLEALHKSFKLDIYLVWCVTKTLILTVAIFSIIFASMGRWDVHSFTSASNTPISMGGYVMFSFCNLMTSEVSGLEASSELARTFACGELIFGFGLLVLMVFVVFTSLRDRHRTDLQAVVSKFQSASSAISDVFESDFSLTKSAVEGVVLGFAPSLARKLIAIKHGKAYAEKLYHEHQQATQANAATAELGSNRKPRVKNESTSNSSVGLKGQATTTRRRKKPKGKSGRNGLQH